MQPTAKDTKLIARAAVSMAMADDSREADALKESLVKEGVLTTNVEFGGEFVTSAGKIIERVVIAAKREGLIESEYHQEAAVAGAAREALTVVSGKAIGFNVGGKIGIAKTNSNIAVCVFFGIGMLHLDDIAIGLGHRAI